ncbi:MAG: CHAD domain-containing protein [Planctomycetia bacterium]|nr:CHAD domain-containing protein [Planctomycetia bacterium]
MVERFFTAADRKLRDPDEIHRLRIEGKKIRYSLEIFAVVFPPRARIRCHDALDRLQKTLGSFTDHTAAAERFERWAEGTAAASNRQLLARLRREEVDLADKARRVFVKWWNPSRRRALRRRFERVLGRCSA